MGHLLFNSGKHTTLQSTGLVILRLVACGFMVVGHGWHKLTHFADVSASFQANLGIPPWMTALAVAAEVGCASLVIIGFATRINVIPLMFAMVTAVVTAQASAPMFTGPGVSGAKEPALMYLLCFTTLMFTGAGKFSIDAILWRSSDESTSQAKDAVPEEA